MLQKYKLVITGLGNPIPAYENTWHNTGKEALIKFTKFLQSKNNCSQTTVQTKNEFTIMHFKHEYNDIKILIPNNIYMNTIGLYLCQHIPHDSILITLYDDIDIEINKIKVTTNPNKTHKGVLSIINNCKTRVKKFIWLKIGIKTEIYTNHYKHRLKDYVLTRIPNIYKNQLANNVYTKINYILTTFIKSPALAMHGY